MSVRIAVLGPPASGKGTQAARIAETRGVPHVSTGDLLREAVTEGTELGEEAGPFMERGDLVPDRLVLEIVAEALADSRGFVLDGFPRTEQQYTAMDVPLRQVVVLEIPQDESLRRITGRRVCPEGHVYHVDYDPPQEEGVCDVDGEPLHQREDDREEVVGRRWREYETQTTPLIARLEEEQVALARVDGCGSPDEVAARVNRRLD